MGIFSKNEEPVQQEPQKNGLFNRNRTSSDEVSSPERSSKGGLSGLMHRDKEDKSIRDARERVVSAEKAEREADKALMEARQSVKAARLHVKKLEEEAEEEAKRAKKKAKDASDISKRAKPLGRHDK